MLSDNYWPAPRRTRTGLEALAVDAPAPQVFFYDPGQGLDRIRFDSRAAMDRYAEQRNASPVRKGRLVALTSPAMGSGKSEVAKVLTNEEGFEPVKFAAGLKAMTRTFLAQLGIDDPHQIERMVEGDLKQAPIEGLDGVTTRHVMQTIGTEWRLTIREDLWARMVEIKVGAMLAKGISVVIDDMRFPVELEMVRRLGGHTIRVVRPGTAPINSHASEGQLDAIEMPEIINDGSLRLLRARTLDLIDTMRT